MLTKNTAPKLAAKKRRAARVINKVKGDEKAPRLSVTISNLHIYAQLIDDLKGHTITSSNSIKLKAKQGATKSEIAKEIGKDIAEKALKHKIKHVRFDRHGKKYHGHLKTLADSARQNGLEF